MFRTARLLLSVACMLSLSTLTFGQKENSQATGTQATLLDGKIFAGQFGKQGHKAEGTDKLIFTQGTFHSTDCDQYGFDVAAYTAHRDGDGITFAAEISSAEEGTIKWQGTAKGDVIEATFTWHKKRWYWTDINQEYWFKGTLEPQK